MPISVNSPLPQPYIFKDTNGYYGDKEYVPHDVRWRRNTVMNFMQRLGTVVIVKHRYTDLDVRNGIALKGIDRDTIYGQARYASLTFSTGYVSVELSDSEWVNITNGQIIISQLNPGASYIQAPKYRGFGPAHETYIAEMDRARDFFSYQPGGAMMNVEEGGVVAPWYPKIFDGDLLIEVVRDKGNNVISANQIWEAKKVTPITMRGKDRKGNIERPDFNTYGNTPNRFIVNQRLDTEIIPALDVRNGIDLDR